MGSGKSAVGRVLARQTGWVLADTDGEVVSRSNKPIHQIFQDQGETAFRALERSAIEDLCAGSQQVISAGGGAFLDPGNRDLMLASGMVFCLAASPETLLKRTSRSRDRAKSPGSKVPVRPLLSGENPLEQIRDLLAQRSDSYAQAHHTIQTDGLTPAQVAQQILDLCRETPVRDTPAKGGN